jgi:ribosomal protein S21
MKTIQKEARKTYKSLAKMKHLKDAPVVRVGDNFERSLRIFKRKIQYDGRLRILNLRRRYPSASARRKVKDKIAAQRFLRHEKLRRFFADNNNPHQTK